MGQGMRRRDVLGVAASGLAWLQRLPAVSAEEARPAPGAPRLDADLAPLVRVLEETPRDRLTEELVGRIRRGLAYRDLLAALLLAGVRNVQPHPVGFKFHAVLVINSAHIASLASPDQQRWLPLLWAADNFKGSQAEEHRKTGWTMGPLDEARVPPPHRARQAFVDAMERWDEDAAEVAAAGLARGAGAHEAFDLCCRCGMRDFRDIGHKAIYVAGAFRVLETIGWRHAEPVLRSLARALLYHDEKQNPAGADLPPDRAWKASRALVGQIRADWRGGKPDEGATMALLETVRQGAEPDAARKVVELLARGVAPASLWDACFVAGAEMNLARADILSLHALTTLNALRHAFDAAADDEIRRLLLLQAAAFMPLFRDKLEHPVRLERLTPAEGEAPSLDELYASLGRDRTAAARRALAHLARGGSARAFCDTGRLLVFAKGSDAHAYKFSSAVFEDGSRVGPRWRPAFLAATVAHLHGSDEADNRVVARARAALAA